MLVVCWCVGVFGVVCVFGVLGCVWCLLVECLVCVGVCVGVCVLVCWLLVCVCVWCVFGVCCVCGVV